MKKYTYILYIAFAIALMMTSSCQKVEGDGSLLSGEEVTVTYNLTVPEFFMLKAAGSPDVNMLRWAVYLTKDENPSSATDMSLAKLLNYDSCAITSNNINATVKFIKDQNYVVIFWAHNSEKNHYIIPQDGDLRTIRMNTTGLKSNDATRDAYYGVDYVVSAKAGSGSGVELKRPLAQINIGTETLTVGSNTVDVDSTEFSVKSLPTAFNPVTGAVSEPADITFEAAAPIKDNGNYLTLQSGNPVKTYTQIAMNYIFASPDQTQSYDISLKIKTNPGGDINIDVSNVSVKGNYKTNIVGDLITTSSVKTSQNIVY